MELIQIGNWQISKVVLDVMWPLVGTLIGGLITYLSARALIDRRLEQERQYKLQEYKRETFKLVLEWFDPLRSSLSKASLLIGSVNDGTISSEEFFKKWPDVLQKLEDPPPYLRALLPKDIYPLSFKIIKGLEDMRNSFMWINSKDRDKWEENFYACIDKIVQLKELTNKFEDLVQTEFRNTYN